MKTKLCVWSMTLVMALAMAGCKGNNNNPDNPSNPQNPENPQNLIAGAFSVSETKHVFFSQGNLQYNSSTNTWRFAEHQWDAIGRSCESVNTSGGYIDMYGWGTGNNPLCNDENSYNSYTDFVDWGTNVVSNGGDTQNTWYTLDQEEWQHIFYSRYNAQMLFALGTVNNHCGVIILPDDWKTPDGITFIPSTTNGLAKTWDGRYFNRDGKHFSDNIYTIQQWTKMEDKGAIFLPCYQYNDLYTSGGEIVRGDYWSSSQGSGVDAEYKLGKLLCFTQQGLEIAEGSRANKCFVRLVKNASAEK